MAHLEKRRWLILVHQLPTHPSNLRVRVWRRLQQIGAIVLRNSLYVLPASEEAREDFNWVREEIESSGGQVSVLEAASVDGHTDAEIMQQFRAARTADYEALAGAIRRLRRPNVKKVRPAAQVDRRVLRTLRERFVAIQARDYFAAAGRALVEQALQAVEAGDATREAASPPVKLRAADFRKKVWVTRGRPGIDRISSAWLIRRFIAPDARFTFLQNGEKPRPAHIPFDIAGVEFGHHGTHCSFETLMHRFAIGDAGALSISRVVHDLDLKETRYAMPEAAAIGRLVDGLRASYSDDAELLEHGIVIIESLYQSFAAEHRSRQPRSKKR